MISIKTEEQIHEFLDAGLPGGEVARHLKLPHRTVYTICAARELAASLSEEQCEAICALLLRGFPAGAVEAILKIPRAAVLAVRRVRYMQHRGVDHGEVFPCPTCGAMMFHECDQEPILHRQEPPPRISTNDTAVQLFRLVEEVAHLGETHIVRNPVFHHLALRAKKTIEKLAGEQYGQAKAG